jgi:hypothetical protein
MMLRPYGVRNRYTVPNWTVTGNLVVNGTGTFTGSAISFGLFLSAMTATADISIPPGFGAVVPGPYNTGAFTVTIGAGSVLQVL